MNASTIPREPNDYFHGLGKNPPPIPENVLMFHRASLRRLQQGNVEYRSHHRFVLILNRAVGGRVHLNHLSVELHPGQTLLIHPYQFHHFSRLESARIDWLFCTFELPGKSFLELFRNRLVETGAESRSTWDRLLNQWLRCDVPATRRRASDVELLQVLLAELLLHLKSDHLARSDCFDESAEEDLIRRVNRALMEDPLRAGTVTTLAEGIGLSESRLRARFRRVAGIPIGGYLKNFRIQRAMELLRNTDHPIAQIAESAGFGSHQAFCRTFREATGQSPRRYRNPD